MSENMQLELNVLLPEIPDEKDQCVERLQKLAEGHRGIEKVHLDSKNGKAVFCIHYDTELLTLEQVERLMLRTGAQVSRRYQHETLHITDMDCGDCARSLEHIMGRLQGVLDVTVNYSAEKMRIEYDSTRLKHEDIARHIRLVGYHTDEAQKPQSWLRRNHELVLALSSGVFLLVGFVGEMLLGLPHTAAVILYIFGYLTGGIEATRHGFSAAVHLKFDVDFLMVVAAIGAAILGHWEEGALLLFLFSFSHSLEHAAMDKARKAIRALSDLNPKLALLHRDGVEKSVEVTELRRNDIVSVKPGERIPIDGNIIVGHSDIDESPITGESVPRAKKPGDVVFAGTINGEGALAIEVTKLAQDTTLARIIKMVEEAQTQKSPTQRLAQKITRIFVPTILGVVVMVILTPPLIGWLSWSEAFLRAMTMLVAASPCALAISTPSAILAGIAQGARNGLLIKGGIHLENLGILRAIAFDKTGTITYGRLKGTDIVALNNFSEDELLRIAGSVESASQHPLAKAVVGLASERALVLRAPNELQSITGKGVRATLDGKTVLLGNLKLFSEDGGVPPTVEAKVEALESEGKTTMLVQRDGEFLGILAFADQPRKEAKAVIRRLQQLGISHTSMITGDNERVAAKVAREVGITEYFANLLPEDKVAAMKRLQKAHKRVAMVGDGVNDAPAMVNATVGVAMGSAGTDVALETADVALMSDALDRLPFAVGLSRQTRKIVLQNLWISMGVIALLLPSAVLGLANISIAIVFHEGSTLVVVANALRLLAYRADSTSD